jgi:hypothetical protein
MMTVEEFLSSGGKIQKLPMGMTGLDPILGVPIVKLKKYKGSSLRGSHSAKPFQYSRKKNG